MLIDSGSDVNIVGNRHPFLVNRTIKPNTDTRISGITGLNAIVLGSTTVNIKVGTDETIYETEFIIIRDSSELILGFPFMVMSRLTIDYTGSYDKNGISLGSFKTLNDQRVMRVHHDESPEPLLDPELEDGLEIADQVRPDYTLEEIKIDKALPKHMVRDLKKLFHELNRTKQKRNYVPDYVFRQSFTAEPSRVFQHKLCESARKRLMEEVVKLRSAGIVARVNEPDAYATISFFSIPKRDGSLRVIADSRVSNTKTKPITECVPNLETLMKRIPPTAKWYSLVDIKKAYFSLKICNNSRKYYRFQAPDGALYEFTRLPMGSRNSASAWSLFIENLLAGVNDGLDEAGYVVYVDDIVLWSTDNVDQHFQLLTLILTRINDSSLAVNNKLEIMQKQISAFGYSFEGGKRTPNEDKLKGLLGTKKPNTYKELHSLVCAIGYFRLCIPRWGSIIAPIWKFITNNKKNAQVDWSNEELSETYDKMLNAASTPVACAGVGSGEFIVTADASDVGIGGVLSQLTEDGRSERPIMFYSRALTKPEKRYSIAFLECRAIEQALLRFEQTINHQPITVRTDSLYAYHTVKNNQYKMASTKSMLLRLLTTISRFNVTIVHNSGKSDSHLLADLLSRSLVKVDPKEEYLFLLNSDAKALPISVITMTEFERLQKEKTKKVNRIELGNLIADYDELERLIVEFQTVDKPTKRKVAIMRSDASFCKNHEKLSECKETTCYTAGIRNALYKKYTTRKINNKDALFMKRGASFKLLIPDVGIKEICKKIHERNHGSAQSLLNEIKNMNLTGYRLHVHAVKTVLSCDLCTTKKQAPSEQTNSPEKPVPPGPWVDIGVDICQEGQGNDAVYFCVTVDNFSKCIWATAISRPTTKCVINSLCTLFSITSTPFCIRTDNGPCFASTSFVDFAKILNIKLYKISPHNSRSNGLNEAAVKRFQGQLRKLDLNVDQLRDKETVNTAVSLATMLSNLEPVNKQRHSPFQSIYGRTPAVLYSSTVPTSYLNNVDKNLSNYYRRIEKIQNETFSNLVAKQKMRKGKNTKFKVGDVCRLRLTKRNKFTSGTFSTEKYQIISIKQNTALITPILKDSGLVKFTSRLVSTRFLKRINDNNETSIFPIGRNENIEQESEEETDIEETAEVETPAKSASVDKSNDNSHKVSNKKRRNRRKTIVKTHQMKTRGDA